MRFFVLALLVAVAAASRLSVGNPDLDAAWKNFKTTYNKKYDTQEESVRRLVWEANMAEVTKHNQEAAQGKHTFTMGQNKFSDMTNEEFRRTMNGFKSQLTQKNVVRLNVQNLAETVDWRTKGIVTPVKNQGQCGSCWSFSTTGSVEGQHALAAGQLVSLSEQQLMDCDQDSNSCEGGLMDNAFQYIIDAGGIESEQDYPYEEQDDSCRADPSRFVATISGYTDVPSGDEDQLKQACGSVGPISVAIDASHGSFQSYNGGVYNEPYCSSSALDHGVLVVGYGNEDGQDYWLVKNSWGPDWGEQGYIKMSRNQDNQCGIATQASYPKV